MGEGELEQVMVDFIEHKFDLLLATTIVESGLDIPNANTIFIDDADRYGLSDLHQLRGRVGRYKHQAYCYLMVAQHKHLSPEATKRLRAIEEFSQMGAGFAISMRDLEIRGAGNLLGSQQSGHIAAVGYEMYCQLLEDAVRQVQNLPPKLSADVDIDLPVEAYLPEDYVPNLRHKIDLYRRMAKINDASHIEEIRDELRDRFGPLPDATKRMLELAELRLDAAAWHDLGDHVRRAFHCAALHQSASDRAVGQVMFDPHPHRRQQASLHTDEGLRHERRRGRHKLAAARTSRSAHRWQLGVRSRSWQLAVGRKTASLHLFSAN